MKKTTCQMVWNEGSDYSEDEFITEELSDQDEQERSEDIAEESESESIVFAGGKYKAIFDHDGDTTFDHQKTIDLYDKYVAGKATRDEWLTYLCTIIEYYLVSVVKRFSRAHGCISNFEDLMASAYLAVIECADDYDPHQSKPTVYFTPRLNGVLNKSFTDEIGNLTSYYNTVKQDVEKELRKFGYTGIDDERLTFAQIVSLTGVPLVTLKKIIEQNKIAIGSLDVYSENHESDEKFISPEENVVKQEEAEVVQKILATLNPVESFILFHSEFADIPLSLKNSAKKTKKSKEGYYDVCPYEERLGTHEMTQCQIAKYLKSKEAKERYGNYIPAKVTGLVVQQILQGALDKLSMNPAAKKYFSNGTKRNGAILVEQCSENDLEQAFIDNVLSFG